MSEERQPAVVDSHEGLDERDKRRLAIAGVITVVSIFVLLFIVKNNRNTDVSFVIFTIKTSLIWVIVLSLIAGAILGVTLPRLLHQRRRSRTH